MFPAQPSFDLVSPERTGALSAEPRIASGVPAVENMIVGTAHLGYGAGYGEDA